MSCYSSVAAGVSLATDPQIPHFSLACLHHSNSPPQAFAGGHRILPRPTRKTSTRLTPSGSLP